MAGAEEPVAVIGGGVVGCAVAHALARRGVPALLLEAEPGLALGASGTNSGILHTGFDSPPGELETTLILRSAELREELMDELGVPVWRCGARLAPLADDDDGAAVIVQLAANAQANKVEVDLQQDGALIVPGEAVVNPLAVVHALAGAARAGSAELRLSARVTGLGGEADAGLTIGLQSGERLRARAVVNCAGLHADEVARLANDDPVTVYPRKGEFLVFSPPAGEELTRILLPVPSALGKGVLVFPTIDGLLIAGPTAREREDKLDWSVEVDAADLILPRARRAYPALARARQIGAYACLRPAGRDAAGRESSYVIEMSGTLPGLLHVAAIRSTGLSAALGIGEYVVERLASEALIEPDPVRPLPAPSRTSPAQPWWERAARHHERSAQGRQRA